MKSKHGSDWTEAEVEQLHLLEKQNVDVEDIAEKLGRTVASVKSKLGRIRSGGVSTRSPNAKWTEADDQKLTEMRRARMSYAATSKELGRSTNAVSYRCGVLGLTANPNNLTQSELAHVFKRHKEGVDPKDIAKELGRSPSGVRKRIKAGEPESVAETPPMSAGGLLEMTDGRLEEEVRATYQRVLTQATTVEMVLYTLYKMPARERPLSIEDAAIKLVLLIGHGPEYFWTRKDWAIKTWFKHLARLNERDMP